MPARRKYTRGTGDSGGRKGGQKSGQKRKGGRQPTAGEKRLTVRMKPKTEPGRKTRTRTRTRKPSLGVDGTPLRSHPELDKELRALVRDLPVPKTVKAIPAPLGYKGGDIDARAENPTAIGKQKFGDKYRDAFPGQDEPLSTSAVRELRSGFYGSANRSAADIEKGRILFENLSKRSRIPTHLVGHATDTSTMQHPTSDPLAVFADAKQTARSHTLLDRERKQRALEAGKAAAKLPGANLETVLNAMEREAYVFTANWMAAPVTADDVRENARRGKGIEVLKLAPTITAREELKSKAVALGATRTARSPKETDLGSLVRDWDKTGKDKREVSPERKMPKLSDLRKQAGKDAGKSAKDARPVKALDKLTSGSGIKKPKTTFPTARSTARTAAADEEARGRTRTRVNQTRRLQQAAEEESGAADALEMLL
ncbi:MAG: hypothetical protein J7518_17580 [Nocardioidaceae bacterium]|nr:hypothetical protein [Nocardioidaceae bacterium]